MVVYRRTNHPPLFDKLPLLVVHEIIFLVLCLSRSRLLTGFWVLILKGLLVSLGGGWLVLAMNRFLM